jgi:WD40 repeat protein
VLTIPAGSHTGHVDSLTSFTNAGQTYIASGSRDHTIKLWSAGPAPAALYRTLRGNTEAVSCLLPIVDVNAPSPRGVLGSTAQGSSTPESRLLASGGGDRIVRIWRPIKVAPPLVHQGSTTPSASR